MMMIWFVLLAFVNSAHGFLESHNLFRSVRHANNFNAPNFQVSKTCVAKRFKAAVDITDLATSTLKQLQFVNETAVQYNIIVKALHSLDKSLALEHQKKIMEAEDKRQYYTRLASFSGQRSALEEFFRKVVDVTRSNAKQLFESFINNSLRAGIDPSHCRYESNKYLCEVISNNPLPQMMRLNHFVNIPEVRAILQPMIGYNFDVPVFEGRLVRGVLSDTKNASEMHDSICVALGDKHSDFFAELARLLQKHFEVFDPVRAYAGQCAVRKEKGLEMDPVDSFFRRNANISGTNSRL